MKYILCILEYHLDLYALQHPYNVGRSPSRRWTASTVRNKVSFDYTRPSFPINPCLLLEKSGSRFFIRSQRARKGYNRKVAYLGDGMGRGLSRARSELRGESGPRTLEALDKNNYR